MPPRGTHVVDHQAVQMIHDWIAQLPPQRKFVKDWATDEFAQNLSEMSQGRQHETGARLYKELGCAQCHRFGDSGGGAGPDLTNVRQKRTPQDLLESILEPSKHIAPEFAATVVVTSDGQSFQGRISREDDQTLVLHTADALAAPVTVLKRDIDERYLSTTSTMPDGLLDTLQKSEILDLLAYIIADANPEQAADAE
jgi:putative heme-binding domain-containing protein